jgi:hypothetical protein
VKIMEDKFWHRAEKVKGATHAGLNRGLMRVNVTFTEEMLEALKARAVAERRSVGGMVRHLCLEGLVPVTPGYQDQCTNPENV